MKYLGPFFLMISLQAFAAPCKVDGISDSPQKLECSLGKELKHLLSCVNGSYDLDGVKVDRAFHLEVDSGSSPLVFKTSTSTLTVVKQNLTYAAELESSSGTTLGQCSSDKI